MKRRLTYLRSTDRFTTANEFTAATADTPTPAGRDVELEIAELLEDFFQVCQAPNKAELAMLSVVCEETISWVRQWCKSSLNFCGWTGNLLS